jgi:hypothetical protein
VSGLGLVNRTGRSPGQRTVAHWMEGGEILPAQLAARSTWGPEVRLAAAVMAATLEHIHQHHAKPNRRRAVEEDLEWVFSDTEDWPFAFIPLCHLVGLDPEYVRAWVQRWLAVEPAPGRRPAHAHRNVA